MSTTIIRAASSAEELWSSFHAWFKLIDETMGAVRTHRRVVMLLDEQAQRAATVAVQASPWREELATCLVTFERARGYVASAAEVIEPAPSTSFAYQTIAVQDARAALDQLAGFLFVQLRTLADSSSSGGAPD